jgi:hypothetical protein
MAFGEKLQAKKREDPTSEEPVEPLSAEEQSDITPPRGQRCALTALS